MYVSVYQHVREAASTNVLFVIQQWMNRLNRVSHSDGLTFSSLSNQPNVLFDKNDSESNLLKQGLVATCWWFYCHIYLSMTDLNQPRCQHKNTFSKILFNYQYWPKFLYFRPHKKQKHMNNSSFNEDIVSINRNLLKNETNFVCHCVKLSTEHPPPHTHTHTHHHNLATPCQTLHPPLILFYN